MNTPFTLPASARILVRGLNWLGDAVMSTPALMRVRDAHPQAHVALLTPPKLAPLYEQHPALDEIIPTSETLLNTARALRPLRFDAAVVLPNSFRAAFEVFLGGVPLRLGFAGNGRSALLTNRIRRPAAFQPMRKRSVDEIRALIQTNAPSSPPPLAAHHVHHYLHLAAGAGASAEPCPPSLRVTEAELAEFRGRFQIPAGSLVLGLCPGAEYGPAKRWPVDRFNAAAAFIQKATGCQWFLFGTDVSVAGQIRLPPGGQDLTGRTSLRQLMAGLKLCRGVLTNDSGPMHVAAALGTPVVVPFGSTSSELTGPGLPGSPGHALLRANVPCSPCFLRECPIDHRCMMSIEVDAVVAAALQLLGKS